MNKKAAIYARVAFAHPKEQKATASQRAALREYAQAHDYVIPPQWVFEDKGVSGNVLARPALERLRDKVAEGAIETVLVVGPDRLSRNCADQVLLLEEFARHGAEVIFLEPTTVGIPKQRLLLQMMAEFERVQIAPHGGRVEKGRV